VLILHLSEGLALLISVSSTQLLEILHIIYKD